MKSLRTFVAATLCAALAGCGGEPPSVSQPPPPTTGEPVAAEKNWEEKIGFHSSYVQVLRDGTVVRGQSPHELRNPACEEGTCSTTYFARIERNSTRCPGQTHLYAQISITNNAYSTLSGNIYDCDLDLVPDVVEQWMIFPDKRFVNVRARRDESGRVVEELDELNQPIQSGTYSREQLERLAVQAYERRSREFRAWAEQEDLQGQIAAYERPRGKEESPIDAGEALRLPADQR